MKKTYSLKRYYCLLMQLSYWYKFKPVFLILVCIQIFTFSVHAQTVITGTVKDETGEPLIGVAVTIKNTTSGTTTNVNGQYNISADPQSILIFTYLVYNSHEVAVAGRTAINVSLQS